VGSSQGASGPARDPREQGNEGCEDPVPVGPHRPGGRADGDGGAGRRPGLDEWDFHQMVHLSAQIRDRALIRTVAVLALAAGSIWFREAITGSVLGVVSYLAVMSIYAYQAVRGWGDQDRLHTWLNERTGRVVRRPNRILDATAHAWLLGTFAVLVFLPGRVWLTVSATVGMLALGALSVWQPGRSRRPPYGAGPPRGTSD